MKSFGEMKVSNVLNTHWVPLTMSNLINENVLVITSNE